MIVYLCLLITGYITALDYTQIGQSEDDTQRLELIKQIHKRDNYKCCAPNYARLCCMSPDSKQMLEELYYDGGPWDQEGANVCKKSLIACRKKGCGFEHGMWAFGCSCLALTVSNPCWAAKPAPCLNVGLVSVLDLLAAWMGCSWFPDNTKSCDTRLSNPQNWPQAKSMSEDDENEIQREVASNLPIIGESDSSSDCEL